MNKNRIIFVVVSVILVLVVVFAIQDLPNKSRAQKGMQISSIGMGEVQRFNAEQAVRNSSGSSPTNSQAQGFGDIHRYENVQDIRSSLFGSGNSVGFGDLRRYEALQLSK